MLLRLVLLRGIGIIFMFAGVVLLFSQFTSRAQQVLGKLGTLAARLRLRRHR